MAESHRVLSAVIILPRHLRRGVPHPDAHASVTHGNCRMVYVSDLCVCVCVCVCVRACVRALVRVRACVGPL